MIKCIIVDDEPPAIGILENYIDRVDYLIGVKSFTDPVAALSFVNREKVDLVFLDINMPYIKGVDLVRALTKRPLIVFTTAYPDFAVEGFQLDVLDYLVKPIAFERFLQTAQRAYDHLQIAGVVAGEGAHPAADYLFIKSGTKMHKVYVKDILLVEGLREYVAVKTGTQTILTLTRLAEMEEALKDKGFIRIHKSYIINLDKIDSVEANQVRIAGQALPVGEKYKSAFEAMIRRKMI